MSEVTAGIQYKGTDICLDLYCECGESTHLDGYFAYAIECGECGKKYDLPTTFTLLPFSATHEPVISEGNNTDRTATPITALVKYDEENEGE